jgi:phosphohistidine phosphatase
MAWLNRAISKCLYLLRHAKSSWDDPTVEDHERRLAPRGSRAAERMARHFSRSAIRPDLVLCSSAARARDTLAPIAALVGLEDRV